MFPRQLYNNFLRQNALKRDVRGVSIIEILFVITIITVGLAGILALASLSLVSSSIAKQTIEAGALAQDTMEAVRNHRDGVPWNDDDPADEYDGLGFVSTGVAHPYHSELSGDIPPRWKLVSGTETLNGFTRQIVFDDVRRDINDDIVESGGVDDPDTKKVTVTVSWQERDRARQVEIVTYLTNWNE
ncbi:hypothetical protein IID24_01780 [Patescibacteria group bacterium]|nr:hypothetical protein [Patescibacteria group bacterium]